MGALVLVRRRTLRAVTEQGTGGGDRHGRVLMLREIDELRAAELRGGHGVVDTADAGLTAAASEVAHPLRVTVRGAQTGAPGYRFALFAVCSSRFAGSCRDRSQDALRGTNQALRS